MVELRELEILHEDNHLLVVNKQAGLPTQGALPGQPSLAQLAKQYLKSRYAKPGNAYLGVVSRLDSQVSGVVVLARTSKAAARLTSQFASGEVHKTYWGIVERPPQPAAGSWVDWLLHNDSLRRVMVVNEDSAGAKQARLTYNTLQQVPVGWLVEIHPETGRKHQIRVQFASRGWPIVGDAKYGAEQPWPAGIALHARRLELVHPVRRTPLACVAPLPTSWHSLGIQG
jgi:23S rRNA pseudouridine1911/1915/1917 synthase